MKERPILFSGPMVRALIRGCKTQSRRVVKWQGPAGFPHDFSRAFLDNPAGVKRLCVPFHHPKDRDDGVDGPVHRHYPVHGEPGDRLWVRETWKPTWMDGSGTAYRADRPVGSPGHNNGPWKPSIFMTRARSRLTLEIVSVRVERLNTITENDAIAEGIDVFEDGAGFTVTPGAGWQRNPDDAYRILWESINGAGSWAENPWVWVVEFKQVTPS